MLEYNQNLIKRPVFVVPKEDQPLTVVTPVQHK